MRCRVECLDDGDGGDGVVYEGSDDSGLLALRCEEGGSEALGDALYEDEDGDGGRMMMVSAHERVKVRTRQVVNEHSLRE